MTVDAWPILLTEEQAAAYLAVSVKTLRRIRDEKTIAPRRLRGLVRYHRDDLDEFAAELPEVEPRTA